MFAVWLLCRAALTFAVLALINNGWYRTSHAQSWEDWHHVDKTVTKKRLWSDQPLRAGRRRLHGARVWGIALPRDGSAQPVGGKRLVRTHQARSSYNHAISVGLFRRFEVSIFCNAWLNQGFSAGTQVTLICTWCKSPHIQLLSCDFQHTEQKVLAVKTHPLPHEARMSWRIKRNGGKWGETSRARTRQSGTAHHRAFR